VRARLAERVRQLRAWARHIHRAGRARTLGRPRPRTGWRPRRDRLASRLLRPVGRPARRDVAAGRGHRGRRRILPLGSATGVRRLLGVVTGRGRRAWGSVMNRIWAAFTVFVIAAWLFVLFLMSLMKGCLDIELGRQVPSDEQLNVSE